jgi:hypothetical protein
VLLADLCGIPRGKRVTIAALEQVYETFLAFLTDTV